MPPGVPHLPQAIPFEQLNTQGIRLVRSELALGLTFSRIALARWSRSQTVERNRTSARLAYDTALRFLPRFSLSPEESAEIAAKCEELRQQLLALGEQV